MSTHTKAFLTNFELSLEFAILAIVGDLIWLVGDVMYNTAHFHHYIVGVFLTVALIGTIFTLYRHHIAYTHRLVTKRVDTRAYNRW